jgi:hypothetical protein
MTQLTQINQAQKPAVPDNLKPQPERSKLHQNVNNVSSQHSFDPEALIKKYAEEREKRLRHNGGLEQYRTIDGQFSHLLTDPYVAEQLERKPIVEQCEALVVGMAHNSLPLSSCGTASKISGSLRKAETSVVLGIGQCSRTVPNVRDLTCAAGTDIQVRSVTSKAMSTCPY